MEVGAGEASLRWEVTEIAERDGKPPGAIVDQQPAGDRLPAAVLLSLVLCLPAWLCGWLLPGPS